MFRSLVRRNTNPTGGYRRDWVFSSMDDYIIPSLYGNVPIWPDLPGPKKNISTTRRIYKNRFDRSLLRMKRSVFINLQ